MPSFLQISVPNKGPKSSLNEANLKVVRGISENILDSLYIPICKK